ncbi:hypothetical protein SAMN02745121_02878 [Nannocystis exedens]|uniref:Cytochrome c domain-containing protein n=1 Tax=Nannocystis exedens TaxID=54 RepID=A0A1I1XHY7_9BACT|nr:hypothetical protein [Nannocystis exedens]PCC73393.1 hypothetical protein NAEX_06481 [Nannocystis exedens]SFE07009.1 hypothetical protein SAMN02745121_02878 [Nannocystis exedens]
MNSVSIPWIASARKASFAALILVAAACDNGGGGSASDTDDTTTDATNATTNNTDQPTSTDATDTTDGTTTEDTGTPTTGAGAVDYEADIQPIWDGNCTTGCHVAGGSASGWFVITPGDSHGALVGKQSLELASMQLIAPMDRDNSYLWHKINNTHVEVGGNGTAMPPPPAAMLSSGDLEKIGAWIDAGAPE